MKDVFITICKFCNRFFKSEDFENFYLKNNKSCPVCRNSDEKDNSNSNKDSF